jgi:NAD(P)-dependent dehydrogenase (short-subunit alcohol dehydrogenase family)
MQADCSAGLFGFAPVEGREVVAAFDGGAMTSDAGALLLGAADRAIKLVERFAECFHDVRRPELIEHEVATLVGQRVFGIALGYEDLNDHDELRHDPVMAVLAGKLEARREDCAPVAGKSTLNRLELSRLEATRYHKISHNPIAIKRLMVDVFLEAHQRAPREIVLDLDATDDPVHGEQEGRFLAAKHFSPNGGSVINISSVASESPTPGASVYSATKGALDTLTSVLARELAPKRIRVNAIALAVLKPRASTRRELSAAISRSK